MTDENKNVNTDYEYSRDTYYELIEKGDITLIGRKGNKKFLFALDLKHR